MPSSSSQRAPFTLILPLATTLLGLGCESGSRPPFRIEVVNAQGQNPVLGAATGRIHVQVAQGGLPTREARADLAGGTFQVDLQVNDYLSLTRIGVTLVRDGATMVGATSSFAPFGFGFVRVPLVPVGSCERVGTQALGTARSAHALVSVDAMLVAVGGLRSDGTPTQSVERWWSPQLTAIEANAAVAALDQASGPARAMRLSGQPRVVVVGSRTSLLTFGSEVSAADFDVDLGVHAGAGAGSALIDMGEGGIVVVGGSSPNVSWIGSDRSVTSSTLPTPRQDAQGALLSTGNALLVVGGNAEGEGLIALIPTATAMRNEVRVLGSTEARHGGFLALAPDGQSALYVGSYDGTDTLTPETFLIRGCPGACEVVPGPTWMAAREHASFARGAAGETWIVGGHLGADSVRTVERITWQEGVPRFVSAGPLVAPREDAAVTHLAGGLVLVSGGRDGDSALSDFELCAPSELVF